MVIINNFCSSKTRPLRNCNRIPQEIMKCSAIQREDVQRGHVASIITTNVQNGVPLHELKPRNIVSIHQSLIDNCLLYAQQDLTQDTVAIVL